MLEGGRNIDTVFRDELSNHEVAPDAYVWESLNKTMQKQKRQSAIIIMWRSIAAACIIALIAVSISLLNRVSEPLINQTAEATQDKVENTPEVSGELASKVEDAHLSEEPAIGNDLDVPVSKEVVPLTQKSDEYEMLYAYGGDNVYKEQCLASITEVNLSSENRLSTELRSKQEKVYYPIYNPLPESENSKKKTTISIGGVLSPSYNSKTSSGGTNTMRAASGVDVNESGINSLGGGLQVRVNTGSRWSFETGVLYAQVGQEVSNNYNYQPYKQVSFNSQASNTTRLANSMGPIVASKSQKLYDAPLTDNMVEASYSAVNSVNEIKQTLDYIEVPIMARYSLFESFPYLSVAGGFSSNFLVDNTAYSLEGGTEQKIGETDHIKPFVLSSSVGIGIDVPLFKSIHLNVEPRLKYFLNSVSSNDDYNFQPYSFGVYGGLTFIIK
ncbi:PorT family protein [Carboxylicivirga sp. A043]|uniref:PorT family protein n=1 Tax=Carboxylicivirga litoralis TaxID=2816963 RepID=UPI0021CB4DD9|nr:PorT family protein [Carboxylicivirga sp. A043]MCU4155456.1 PorT family protein [Carboxylicivirga sp. A043]